MYKLLSTGLAMFCLGIYISFPFLTFESQLTGLKSTLRNSTTYVSTVEAKGHQSQKSELIFYLNRYENEFALVENIGDRFVNERHEKIDDNLKNADYVTVWIKKSQLTDFRPRIYQIDTNIETNIYNYKTENLQQLSFGLTFSIIGTLLLIGCLVYKRIKFFN